MFSKVFLVLLISFGSCLAWPDTCAFCRVWILFLNCTLFSFTQIIFLPVYHLKCVRSIQINVVHFQFYFRRLRYLCYIVARSKFSSNVMLSILYPFV